MSDNDLIRRGDALAVLMKAQIASCTCLTKTPDPDWHREGCRYRILREAEAMIEHVPTFAMTDATVAHLVPEVGSVIRALDSVISEMYHLRATLRGLEDRG